MRNHFKVLAAFIALTSLAIASPSFANELRFIAHLDGSQEVPPVTTDGTGTATFTVNSTRTEIAFDLTVEGIDPANIMAAEIHVGAVGVPGPAIFTLSPTTFTSPLSGVLTDVNLTPQAGVGVSTFADAISMMLAGTTYVDVHTPANPNGEIRGQIGLIAKIKVRRAINPRSHVVIAVPPRSSPDFDARSVDPASVRFGPALAQAVKTHLVDVNGDGLADLLLHFRTQATGIRCGDKSVGLVAVTSTGLQIEATAPIKTPGCH